MREQFWQGKRVRLRAVEPDDWQHFFDWNGDTEVSRLTYHVDLPQSREALKRWAAELSTAEAKDDQFRWVIEDLEGEFLGTINTHTCDPRNGTFQYGLAIRREHWRRGYATEAISIVLRYYFHELRYQKVNVHIYDFNPDSLALHRRLGFTEEGRLRRMGYTQGRYFDWVCLGLTREEFEASELC